MSKSQTVKKLQNFINRVNESLYSADNTYQSLLSYFLNSQEKTRVSNTLKKWEKNIPYWNALADEASRTENLPRLERFDRVGNKLERIIIPLETRLIRHKVVECGIFRNQSEIEKFSKVYLLAQIGEAGVISPLAHTDSIIRLLCAKGSEYLKNKYIESLESADIPLAGAVFITERSSGSDLSALETIAKTKDHKHYELFGSKWFCSTPEEYFLVAARTEGSDAGTNGLSLFLMQHMIPNAEKHSSDYMTNHFSIRRLKDKLGTQALPTAEIEFEGSHAHMVGYPSEGFSNLLNYVINSLRLHGTAQALGMHRRAFVEARNYALQRVAFGKSIINYPMIAETLVSLLSHLSARQVMFFELLKHIDDHGWFPKDENLQMWQRFLINMTKYRSSFRLTEMIKEAALILGGNGAINDFSILPRLLRDGIVAENWLGTHNTLCLQIVRDLHKYDLIGRLNNDIESIISQWPDNIMADSRKIFIHNYEIGCKVFISKNLYNLSWAQTHAKRFINHFSALLETGTMVKAGVKTGNANLLIQASYLIHELLSDRFAGFVSPTIEHLNDTCQDLIREIPIDIDMK